MQPVDDRPLTRNEREDLLKVARLRERVAKSEAKRRASELLADFEQQMARQYSFDENEIWAAAYQQADQVVAGANETIRNECAKLGIPPQFAPRIGSYWSSRGENIVGARRAELRKVARSRIEEILKSALERIERGLLEFQTSVLAIGMSGPANALLSAMPDVSDLMPKLVLQDGKLIGSPEVEHRFAGTATTAALSYAGEGAHAGR